MAVILSKEEVAKSDGAGKPQAAPSRALEWLWGLLCEFRNPHVFDCGPTCQRNVDVLMGRGAKLYVADLISPTRRREPALWDRSGKQPVFLIDKLLSQVPAIPSGSLSAIFCWHLLDLVPRESVPALVERFYSYLRPGGALFCLLREPYLAAGAETAWRFEGLTVLGSGGQAAEPFPYPVLTNRDLERLVAASSLKTFLTRAGRREVLAIK